MEPLFKEVLPDLAVLSGVTFLVLASAEDEFDPEFPVKFPEGRVCRDDPDVFEDVIPFIVPDSLPEVAEDLLSLPE